MARTIIARQARDLNRLAQLARQEHAPGMTCGYRVFVRSNMAFAGSSHPPLAKHSKSFSLIECISVGFDRTSELRADAKASGSMREKGIDGRHRSEERRVGKE